MERPRRAAAAAINYNSDHMNEFDEYEEAPQHRPTRLRARVVDSDEDGESVPAPKRATPAANDTLSSAPSGLGRFGFAAAEKSSAINAMMNVSTSRSTSSNRKEPKRAPQPSRSRRAPPVGTDNRSSGRASKKMISYAEQESSAESDDGSASSERSVCVETPSPPLPTGARASSRTRQAPARLDAATLLASTARQSSGGVKRKRPAESSGDSSRDSDVESSSASSCKIRTGRGGSGSKPTGDIEYRIQQILGSKKLTPEQWRAVTGEMTTLELTRGSVWEAPDSEYFSNSPVPVEKFFIKWQHASYLHVSWELEADLLDFVGPTAKTAINKYRERAYYGQDLFEDIGSKEYFPPSFLVVERVIDVDSTNSIQSVDWENAILPPLSTSGGTATSTDMEIEPPVEPKVNYLHSPEDCYLTIKWEGLPYHDCTFENVKDLVNRGIDYETALRAFYRREQSEATSKPRKTPGISSVNRILAKELKANQDEVPKLAGGELRDYQWESVRWLSFNWSQRRNSILADEMGLGKTIQAAAFLHCLKAYQGIRGPFLIIAPLSTLINWVRELTSWTDLDVVLYHGSQEDRELIREYEFRYLSKPPSAGYKVQVVVTSFETAVSKDYAKGQRELSQIHWEMLVIDEAHKIKNYSSKLNVTLREDYKFRNCLLLTGTPLQNNTDELWSLLNFVDQSAFPDLASFKAKYGELKESEQLQALQTQLRPYLLRRIKENVEKSVPPKEELIIEVELTVAQKQYYRAIFEQNRSFLFRGGSKNGPGLANLAMELRKCCNHPFLVKGAEQALLDHFHKDKPLDVMVDSSGKLVLLDKLLPKLLNGGHKVLIFSQFRIMLDILEDYLAMRGYFYSRIDGAITGRHRQEAIDRFSAPDSNQFVMLLSTRAGGVGINLTTADTVIIFDSDWNPQNDIQAQARAHRIGQKKNVKVYRLLTRKTYEMHLFNVASLKLGLDYALMHNLRSQYGPLPVSNQREIGEDGGEKTISSSDNLSKKEIENLLKHGAYDMFREEKDGQGEEASKRFCEEDIDSILQRSTLIVHKGGCAEVHEDGTVVPGTGGALNSFAKASFVSSKEGDTNDVALDDPLFWEKVVGVSNGDMGNSSSEEYEDLEGNTQRRKMNRKRRCARIIGSYKEVGMNFQELSGISTKGAAFDSNEDDAVSNGSDDDDRGARKGRSNSGNKKKREIHLPRTLAECSNQDRDDNEIEREKMTAEAYDAIATCLGVYGYGSWVVIANALEHRFSSNQIARAGRAIVLQVFKNACLTAGVAAETEEGETRPEIQAIVSVSKVQAKALCSSLYLFVHLADMMTSYVVSNNLRESHDIPDDCVLLQWVVDRIVRLKTPVNNMASFFDTSPQPIFYQSVPSFRALIEQTLEEYVSNIASNASPFPAFNFSTTFTAEAAATQLNDLKVPVGFTGSKLKLTALESLFDLMIMNRISEGKLMLAAPPSGPAAATTAIETPLAALLRKSTMFVDFFKAERLVLPEKAQELAWWTDLHDSLMLVCLFECGWSTQSFKTLIIPIFEAVGEHLGPQCFAIDIKIMRGLMGIIFKRVKDVLSATKTPSKRELPRQQTTCLLKALQNYGIPFTGLYQRQSFLPPSVLLEPTAAVEVQVKAATDTAMHIADDDRMEIVKNFPKDFPDRPRLWRPYPATAVIPGECSQLDPLKHPRTNAIFGLPPSPLMTWEIVAAHANGAMKADQIEECTLYLLSHAREIMQYSATSSDQGVFNSVLGPLKPKVVKETIVKIETIWTIQSILMLDNVDSGASGCVAHTEEFDLSVITKDLCPEHQELANIFSQRLKKLNGSWPGFMDVRLLRMLLYCGCDLVAVSKHKVHLLKEEERGDISIPTAQVLLQRAISIVDLVGRPYVPPVVREPPKLSNAFQKMSSIDAVQRAWPMAISQSRPAVSQTLPICEEKSLPQYSSSSTGVVMQRLNSETAPIIPSYPPVAHLTPGLIPGTTTMDNTSAAIKADKKVDLSAAKKPHQMSLMMSFSKAKLKQDEKANIRDEVAAAINAAAVAAQKKLSGCDAAVMSPDSSVLLVALE